MVSVENFYWVLYENLLKPSTLDCWYYYPWGTKNHLSRATEFQKFSRKQHYNHALFHFDQEPLWTDDLGWIYEDIQQSWSTKVVRLLANSEHSAVKKQIIKSRSMLDWYYFYHGFAALDWYRDTQYIDHDAQIEDAFLSFNHVIAHQRIYRLDLIAHLIDKGILHLGKISLHSTQRDIDFVLESDNYLTARRKKFIQQSFFAQPTLPWRVDTIAVNGNCSARFGHQEYKLWQSSLLHIVNETVFYEPKLHLTEKIFKPIVSKRPFVLVAAPGNLAYLRSYGFLTFGTWIDESYDNIEDPSLRLKAITNEIAKLSQLNVNQLRDLHHDMQPVLDYNKKHFFGDFRKIIVEELVDNFDCCVRIWNNGRVDGREIPWQPNLAKVKILLGR